MPADRQIHAPARAHQFLGDLRPRGPRSHHQHGAIRKLPGIAVSVRVHLHRARVIRNDRRHHGALKRAGGGDHVISLDRPGRGLRPETRPAVAAPQVRDRHAAAHRGGDGSGIGDEIIHDLVAGREFIAIDTGDRVAWHAVAPGGSVGVQPVPAFGPPALDDPVPFQNQVRPAALAQPFAHRQPGLAAADDQGLDAFNRHLSSLAGTPAHARSIPPASRTAPSARSC